MTNHQLQFNDKSVGFEWEIQQFETAFSEQINVNYPWKRIAHNSQKINLKKKTWRKHWISIGLTASWEQSWLAVAAPVLSNHLKSYSKIDENSFTWVGIRQPRRQLHSKTDFNAFPSWLKSSVRCKCHLSKHSQRPWPSFSTLFSNEFFHSKSAFSSMKFTTTETLLVSTDD